MNSLKKLDQDFQKHLSLQLIKYPTSGVILDEVWILSSILILRLIIWDCLIHYVWLLISFGVILTSILCLILIVLQFYSMYLDQIVIVVIFVPLFWDLITEQRYLRNTLSFSITKFIIIKENLTVLVFCSFKQDFKLFVCFE